MMRISKKISLHTDLIKFSTVCCLVVTRKVRGKNWSLEDMGQNEVDYFAECNNPCMQVVNHKTNYPHQFLKPSERGKFAHALRIMKGKK
jgi:hypothetical protein